MRVVYHVLFACPHTFNHSVFSFMSVYSKQGDIIRHALIR